MEMNKMWFDLFRQNNRKKPIVDKLEITYSFMIEKNKIEIKRR